MKTRTLFVFFAAALAVAAMTACGGGGSSSTTGGSSNTGGSGTTGNQVAITVNAGPANIYTNGVFTNVTVCLPGTTSCQTIGGVLVDTGSVGLRLLSSALTLPLANATVGSGTLVECVQFLDGFTWGPVATADVQMAGEKASSIPIQVIGSPAFPDTSVPSACSSTGPAQDNLQALAANGILGVGSFLQDCGPACTTQTNNPNFYYSCTSAGCNAINATLAQQLANPVAAFPVDNNGVVLTLPQIAPSGAVAVTGTMTFGIGTQSNNGLGNAAVLTTDCSGNITTIFNGVSYPFSFIDSGSNAYYFLDPAKTGLPDCGGQLTGFYCPATTTNLTATNRGANGVSSTVNFSVANINSLPGTNNAFNNVAGSSGICNPLAATPQQQECFDWGLPFFFGRSVFTAIEGRNTPGGLGPYFAY